VTIFATTDAGNSGTGALEEKTRLSLAFNPGDITFYRNQLPRRTGEPLTEHGKEYEEKFSHFIVGDAFSDHSARIEPRPPFNVEKEMRRVDWSFRGKGLLARSVPRYADGIESYVSYGANIPLGPASPPTPAERGELLFAGDTFGYLNCNDCHRRGHTTYELSDTLADGTTNTPKRIPTLLGTRLSDPWAWNGRFRNLDEQVKSSLETTMHVQNITPEQIGDLTAFLHTLPPPPPLEPATDDPADQEKLSRGKDLFTSLGCAKCHVPPLTYTSPDTYDVGLADEAGLTKFNPPSLRGVSQGYAFFHDARAKTLAEVFTVHAHQLPRDLHKEELSDLLRFLRSL
jgi:cytochrome c peroxidase